MIKLVYIAGPYRPIEPVDGANGYTVMDNILYAKNTALSLITRAGLGGFFPLTPHLNTAQFEVDVPFVNDEYWLKGTLDMMKRCDAVLVVDHPALGRSSGTRFEVETAMALGIPVFGTIEELVRHRYNIGSVTSRIKPDLDGYGEVSPDLLRVLGIQPRSDQGK